MFSPFHYSPVNRECLWKKTQMEKNVVVIWKIKVVHQTMIKQMFRDFVYKARSLFNWEVLLMSLGSLKHAIQCERKKIGQFSYLKKQYLFNKMCFNFFYFLALTGFYYQLVTSQVFLHEFFFPVCHCLESLSQYTYKWLLSSAQDS